MSYYYPQGALVLSVLWEDFESSDANLQKAAKITVFAKSLSVEINDYKEADKFKATIDYNSFPFDPRCIRSLGVSIHMQDMKSLDIGGILTRIIPSEDNTVFVGYADESTIEFDETKQEVMIEGRDYTSLFIDQKRLKTDPIPLARPLGEIIQGIIDEQEATKNISVENRTGSELPVLGKVAKDFNPTTSVKNQKRKETYWDIIQAILNRTALIGFIEKDKLVIDKPQNIYAKKNLKQFIYGGNIKSLKFTRKMGRLKDFNVRVLSLHKNNKSILEAKIPEEALDPNIKGPRVSISQLDKDGKKIEPPKDADFITFKIPNVKDKESLIGIGESIFEELSRQQIEGSMQTFEMEIPEELGRLENGVTATTPVKFSELRNGSAVNILLSMDEKQVVNSDSTKAEKVKFLVRRGYPRDVAEQFANSLNRINTPFYVKSVSFEMSQEDGFTMDIDFINFIDIDKSLVGK